MKKEQRVIDLTKIDSNEKAFLLGFVNGAMYKKNTEKLLNYNILNFEYSYKNNNIEEIKKYMQEHFDADIQDVINEKCKQNIINKCIKNNVVIDITEWRYVKSYTWCEFNIVVTKGSENYILASLASIKKQYFPYLLKGLLYIGCSNNFYRCINNNALSICKHTNTIHMLKKKLIQWYNFEEKALQIKRINNKFSELKIIGNQNINNFKNIIKI